MSQQKHWLDFAEITTAVLSVGGASITAIGQSAAFATIPLSLSVALNLINRQRLLGEMNTHHQAAITSVNNSLLETEASLKENLQQHSQQLGIDLNQLRENLGNDLQQIKVDFAAGDQNLKESLETLDHEKNKLAEIVGDLQKIENFSQAIRTNPDCGDFYYQRGLSHQNLGDKEGAIADYTQAIALDIDHAAAHHQRGILEAELGNRRQAVEDLRRAAKLYFEQGDIDSYQQARDLSKEFHEIHTPVMEEGSFEKVKIRTFLS